VGVDKIGSKTYFVFMSFNLACIPIIALLFPETNGRALEDMDDLFKKKSTDTRSSLDGNKNGTAVGAGEV